MATGALVGMAGVWGVNGVFWYSLMRAYATAPGTASGAVATMGHLGGTLGPLAFGVVAQHISYPTAWIVSAVAASLAAAGMFLASPRLDGVAASHS